MVIEAAALCWKGKSRLDIHNDAQEQDAMCCRFLSTSARSMSALRKLASCSNILTRNACTLLEIWSGRLTCPNCRGLPLAVLIVLVGPNSGANHATGFPIGVRWKCIYSKLHLLVPTFNVASLACPCLRIHDEFSVSARLSASSAVYA